MLSRIAAIACLGLLAACAAPPPPSAAPSDPRVILTPNVAALGFSLPNVTNSRDGRLQVTINVANGNAADFPLRIQTDWLNASGRPIQSLQSRPQQLLVPRFGTAIITADAPNDRARDFRMQIDIDAP
jgi:uncharacterized protein YcfL